MSSTFSTVQYCTVPVDGTAIKTELSPPHAQLESNLESREQLRQTFEITKQQPLRHDMIKG